MEKAFKKEKNIYFKRRVLETPMDSKSIQHRKQK